MSPNDDKKSARPDSPREGLSVYDFLYHDARRIGSFLAQFYEAGLPQSIKQSKGTEESENTKYGSQSGINTIIKVGGQFERQSGSSVKDAIESQYDPFWTHSLTLIDQLNSRGMIYRQFNDAAIWTICFDQGYVDCIRRWDTESCLGQ